MKRVLLLLMPAVVFAGQPRYARLGDFDGVVDVQLHPADPWSPGERNLTLRESAWLRTGASSRLEIELDEGSAWRLGPDSQVEISDYSLLSSGQRLTVLSLDHGLAYFTGEPFGKDSLMLVAPGAQVTLMRGARVRIEARAGESRVAVIEGVVRLSCPAAEIDLHEGQSVRVEPGNTDRFSLDREIAAMDLDHWSEERDKILAAPASGTHVLQHFGLADLDASGEWLQTDLGAVWKPRIPEGWAPFQYGRWRWYDGLGYTWVSADSWGWLPYHFGRWTRKNDLGWVWVPANSAAAPFKPGDVFWLYGLRMAGWGPLAPGEDWTPAAAPQQFLTVNTTWAAWAQDALVIDPAGFTGRPRDPMAVSVFRLALPSPAFLPSRLDAVRPALRVGSTHFKPVLPGTTFPDANDVPPPAAPPVPPPVTTAPPADAPPGGYPPDPGPAGPPMQTTYPVPVYTGIVVINPPDHPDYSRPNPNGQKPNSAPARTNGSNPTNPKPGTQPPQPAGTSTPPASSAQSLPRVVKPPEETRPNSGPRMAPAEHPKTEAGPRQIDSAPKPAAAPAPPPPPRIEAPRPAPAPPAPRIEAPKAADVKADTKTDTSSTKKQ